MFRCGQNRCCTIRRNDYCRTYCEQCLRLFYGFFDTSTLLHQQPAAKWQTCSQVPESILHAVSVSFGAFQLITGIDTAKKKLQKRSHFRVFICNHDTKLISKPMWACCRVDLNRISEIRLNRGFWCGRFHLQDDQYCRKLRVRTRDYECIWLMAVSFSWQCSNVCIINGRFSIRQTMLS